MQAEATIALQGRKDCAKNSASVASSSNTAMLITMGLWSKLLPLRAIRHPQLMKMKQDRDFILGSCFSQCQASPGATEDAGVLHSLHSHRARWAWVLLKAGQKRKEFCSCPHLTHSFGANGAPDNPLSAPLGYRTRGTFLPSGMWVACCSNPCRNGWCFYEKTV